MKQETLKEHLKWELKSSFEMLKEFYLLFIFTAVVLGLIIGVCKLIGGN